MRALVAVVLAVFAAGCAGEEGSFAFQRGDAALEPYFMEYHEIVSGSHSKVFDVPVDAPASLVNVTIVLDTRSNGLPVPDAAPARLTVRLVDPAGATVGEAELDAQESAANLVLEDAAPGLYRLQVDGFGASQDVDGATYGSGYVVTVDVGYA